MKNAAVLEVSEFGLGVDAHLNLELLAAVGGHVEGLAHLEVAPVGRDVEGLLTREAEGLCVLAWQELEGQHTHTHEVASVDTLIALSDNCLNTLKVGSLSSPISGRS